MKTMYITKAHILDGVYVGPDLSEWPGHINIERDLGTICFEHPVVTLGNIHAKPGTGIKSLSNVNAGQRLRVELGLETETGLEVGGTLDVGLDLKITASISVGRSMSIGGHIMSAGTIWCGGRIRTPGHITASGNVVAGLGISAASIGTEANILAGIFVHHPFQEHEKEIHAEIRSGKITHGVHVPPPSARRALVVIEKPRQDPVSIPEVYVPVREITPAWPRVQMFENYFAFHMTLEETIEDAVLISHETAARLTNPDIKEVRIIRQDDKKTD